MTAQAVVGPCDFAVVRGQTDLILSAFLEGKDHTAAAHQLPAEVTEILRNFLFAGGKRLRPVLCVTGWHAASGHGTPKPVLQVAAALEMFHTFALIHDDIMDHSHTRRGHPTVHRALATRHRDGRTATAASQLGTGAAILIGDLALAWSDELLHTAGLTPTQSTAVLPLIDAMRTEVMYGQYLDLTTTGHPTGNLERAIRIVRYKTAKYTIERPLHIGAALAGADHDLLNHLSDFALPVGEAFQLRDDLLGLYGNPEQTGKSVLDDLRDGKHTALIALVLRDGARTRVNQLRPFLGCRSLTEDQAAAARRIIDSTGARASVEDMIRSGRQQAERVLDTAPFAPVALTSLRHIVRTTTGV
ncbi:polyprenyl synthetase family protein [Streptomyces olivoreticuli]